MDFAIIKTTVGDVFECFWKKTSPISKHASFIYGGATGYMSVYYSILSVAVCLQRKEDTIWQKEIEFTRTDSLSLYLKTKKSCCRFTMH